MTEDHPEVEGAGMTARTPDDCDRLFAACVRARDAEGLLALYETDARYVCRDGTVVIGREAIRPLLERLTMVPTEIEIRIVEVVTLDDIAVVYNTWTTRSEGVAGRALEASGHAVEIVRRHHDGRWLFAIDDPFGRTRRL